jgi:predicted nucleic acid-binding Zn ribbon protein
MREINENDTRILLTMLNSEINNKCNHIKSEKYQQRSKNTFFISCFVFLLLFILQIVLRLLNISLLTSFILYQVIIMAVIVPLLFKSMKGVYLNEKN